PSMQGVMPLEQLGPPKAKVSKSMPAVPPPGSWAMRETSPDGPRVPPPARVTSMWTWATAPCWKASGLMLNEVVVASEGTAEDQALTKLAMLIEPKPVAKS